MRDELTSGRQGASSVIEVCNPGSVESSEFAPAKRCEERIDAGIRPQLHLRRGAQHPRLRTSRMRVAVAWAGTGTGPRELESARGIASASSTGLGRKSLRGTPPKYRLSTDACSKAARAARVVSACVAFNTCSSHSYTPPRRKNTLR